MEWTILQHQLFAWAVQHMPAQADMILRCDGDEEAQLERLRMVYRELNKRDPGIIELARQIEMADLAFGYGAGRNEVFR